MRFRLEPYATRESVPLSLATYPDFLERLLRSAADKLGAGERLVVVLDALDEAGVTPGHNVLGLPRYLPRGVYLVVSQRPQPVQLPSDPLPQPVYLRANDPDNLADVDHFLHRLTTFGPLGSQLGARNGAADDFARIVAEKCEGNWQYLFHVVAEIRSGQRAPNDLAALPKGLVAYYAQYWNRWRERPEWDTLYAPLLVTLAASFEPVPLPQLKRWAGVQASDYTVRRLLREDWRAFILELNGERYGPNHASLHEFFSGLQPAGTFPPDVEGLLAELKDRIREAHGRIVADLRDACSGNWPLLAGESPPTSSSFSAAEHARSFLSAHLARSGEHEELLHLVDDTVWYRAQTAADLTGTTYLADIARAWAAAEQVDMEAVRRGDPAYALGRELRCALVTTSLHNRFRDISPTVLAAVATLHMWPARQVLAVAGAYGNGPDAAATVLQALLDETADAQKPALLDEALVGVGAIKDVQRRVLALVVLLPHLPEQRRDPVLRDLEATAARAEDAQSKVLALTELGRHTLDPKRTSVLDTACSIAHTLDNVSPMSKIELLAALADELPEPKKSELLQEARAAIGGGDEPTGDEVSALMALVPHFTAIEQASLIQHALTYARGIQVSDDGDVEAKSIDLALVANALPEPQRREAQQEALSVAHALGAIDERARLLAQLVPMLTEPEQTAAIQGAMAAARASNDDATLIIVLGYLAPFLPLSQRTGMVQEAFTAAQGVADSGLRSSFMAHLVPQLSELQRAIATEALRAQGAIEAAGLRQGDEVEHVRVLAMLSSLLSEPQRTIVAHKAHVMAQTIDRERAYDRACALLAMTSCLSGVDKGLAVQEVLATDLSGLPVAERADVLAALSAHVEEPTRTEVLQQALFAARDADEVQTVYYGTVREQWLGEFLVSGGRLVESPSRRARPLALVATLLPETQKSGVLEEAWDSVCQVPESQRRAEVLGALAPYLPEPLVRRALGEVQRAVHGTWEQEWLTALILQLKDLGYGQEALQAARTVWGDGIPANTAALLEPVEKGQLENALVQFAAVGNEEDSHVSGSEAFSFTASTGAGKMLNGLSPLTVSLPAEISLSEQEKDRIIVKIERAVAAQLVSELSKTDIDAALESARDFRHGDAWLHAKAALLARLAALTSGKDALDIASSIWEAVPPCVIAALVPYIEDSQRTAAVLDVLGAVRELPALEQASTLALLASHLVEPFRSSIVQQAVTAVQSSMYDQRREHEAARLDARTLSSLVPLLPTTLSLPLLQRALRQRAANDRRSLLSDLLSLLPILGVVGGPQAWNEAADAVMYVGNSWP